MASNRLTGFDEHFFAKVLRDVFGREDIEVTRVVHECISAKGTNFLSDLFRVSLTYRVHSAKDGRDETERSVDLILKMEPRLSTCLQMAKDQELFPRELKVLRDVLPRIEKSVGRRIGPKFFYSAETPPAIVMEDLAAEGFIMKDRQRGLSLEHCVMAIERVAMLHAGSVALFEEDPDEASRSFRGGILSESCPASFFRMIEVSLKNVARAIETWSDERCSRAAKKLEKLGETICADICSVYEHNRSHAFRVLNHGDCWTNNIMFKETERGEPCDVAMVDYQMSVYASPAVDLLYFLNICPQHEVKYDEEDRLLGAYLRALTETMKSIGCRTKPPTMLELREAMHEKRIYAVFAGVILFLRMLADAEDTEDFHLLLHELKGETRMDVFKNSRAVRATLKMIPIMDERGYFD